MVLKNRRVRGKVRAPMGIPDLDGRKFNSAFNRRSGTSIFRMAKLLHQRISHADAARGKREGFGLIPSQYLVVNRAFVTHLVSQSVSAAWPSS